MRWSTRYSILFLLGIAIVAFSISVYLRNEWRTTLSMEHHQWLTGSTLVHAKNWFRQGPQNVGFAHILNPRSIEFKSLSERGIYVSYPVGCLIPVYALAKILNVEPTEALVMNYNLTNHFLVGFLLSLIVFFTLRRTGHDQLISNVLSLVPIAAVYFSPSLMYWFQNVYWADQAVILPVVLLLLLETVPVGTDTRTGRVLYSSTVFYACFTDYLGFVVAGALWAVHWITADRDRRFLSRQLVLPSGVALGLFLGQVHMLDSWDRLIDKFLFRTAFAPEGQQYVSSFFNQFYLGWIVRDFGYPGLVMFAAGFLTAVSYLGYRLYRRSVHGDPGSHDPAAAVHALTFMLVVPPVVQTWLLSNHSVIHDFSALKFGIPYAALVVLLPLAGLLLCRRSFTDLRLPAAMGRLPYVPLVILAVFVWHQSGLVSTYRQYFPPPSRVLESQGPFLGEATGYRDVVFSFSMSIPALPPQALAYSMKRVYQVQTFQEALNRLRQWDIYGTGRINFVFDKDLERDVVAILRTVEGLNRYENSTYFLVQTKPEILEQIITDMPLLKHRGL